VQRHDAREDDRERFGMAHAEKFEIRLHPVVFVALQLRLIPRVLSHVLTGTCPSSSVAATAASFMVRVSLLGEPAGRQRPRGGLSFEKLPLFAAGMRSRTGAISVGLAIRISQFNATLQFRRFPLFCWYARPRFGGARSCERLRLSVSISRGPFFKSTASKRMVSSAAKLKRRKYDRKGPYACLVWSRPLVLPWTAVDGGARKASNLSFTIE
jgi:hypothetical protein